MSQAQRPACTPRSCEAASRRSRSRSGGQGASPAFAKVPQVRGAGASHDRAVRTRPGLHSRTGPRGPVRLPGGAVHIERQRQPQKQGPGTPPFEVLGYNQQEWECGLPNGSRAWARGPTWPCVHVQGLGQQSGALGTRAPGMRRGLIFRTHHSSHRKTKRNPGCGNSLNKCISVSWLFLASGVNKHERPGATLVGG